MEFNFNLTQLLKCDRDGIGIITGESIPKSVQSYISIVLDAMGEASSKAQGLRIAITTGAKFINSNQTIFIICEGKTAIGFIKVGKKNLFIRDSIGTIKEISPLCVLDFYVHESQQRSGYGKILFTKMIDHESVEPRKLGYDRPSEKLLSFLEKYYNLKNYVPQNNNFVVFNDYFETTKTNTTVNKDNPIQVKKNKKSSFYGDEYEEDKYDNFDNYEKYENYNKYYENENIYQKKKPENVNNKFVQNSKIKEITKSANKSTKKDYSLESIDQEYENMNKNFEEINLDSKFNVPDDINDNKNRNKRKNSVDNKNRNNKLNQTPIKNNSNNPPWAVSDSSNSFMPTSSSYGAYFTIKKKY